MKCWSEFQCNPALLYHRNYRPALLRLRQEFLRQISQEKAGAEPVSRSCSSDLSVVAHRASKASPRKALEEVGVARVVSAGGLLDWTSSRSSG
jgi:hypothetical protein